MMGVFVPFDDKPRRAPIGWVIQENGCWDWVGIRNDHLPRLLGECGTGYGRVTVNGKLEVAHRVVWERFRGPIPIGLTLDHLCRRRCCVNPDHLEPVGHSENCRRGAKMNRTGKCPHGHDLSGDNVYVRPRGVKACRVCARIQNRRWSANKKLRSR